MADFQDADGYRLPIKLDATTNGEFEPIPLAPVHEHANALARAAADEASRRLNRSRRDFLVSACGAASTLLAMNRAYASDGPRGGWYDLPDEAAYELALAEQHLAGDEFIFDVQGHYVNPEGDWLKSVPDGARPFGWSPKAGCALADEAGDRSYLRCFGADEFITVSYTHLTLPTIYSV